MKLKELIKLYSQIKKDIRICPICNGKGIIEINISVNDSYNRGCQKCYGNGYILLNKKYGFFK